MRLTRQGRGPGSIFRGLSLFENQIQSPPRTLECRSSPVPSHPLTCVLNLKAPDTVQTMTLTWKEKLCLHQLTGPGAVLGPLTRYLTTRIEEMQKRRFHMDREEPEGPGHTIH